MSEIKFKIGEFSRLSKVTVRALRHYEQIGLLIPEIVDRWTGGPDTATTPWRSSRKSRTSAP